MSAAAQPGKNASIFPYVVVLAGDSVIDNGSYVDRGQLNVGQQVAVEMGDSNKTVQVAADGGVIATILPQLRDLELQQPQPTHLVLSVGGNDVLQYEGLTRTRTQVSAATLLDHLAEIRSEFAADYAKMIERVTSKYKIPLIVSTIYYPVFPDENSQRRAVPLLALFNDVILSIAAIRRLPVLDLRWISTQKRHYANPIEPSAAGGKRIATTIARIIREHEFDGPSSVYTYPDARFTAEPFV